MYKFLKRFLCTLDSTRRDVTCLIVVMYIRNCRDGVADFDGALVEWYDTLNMDANLIHFWCICSKYGKEEDCICLLKHFSDVSRV